MNTFFCVNCGTPFQSRDHVPGTLPCPACQWHAEFQADKPASAEQAKRLHDELAVVEGATAEAKKPSEFTAKRLNAETKCRQCGGEREGSLPDQLDAVVGAYSGSLTEARHRFFKGHTVYNAAGESIGARGNSGQPGYYDDGVPHPFSGMSVVYFSPGEIIPESINDTDSYLTILTKLEEENWWLSYAGKKSRDWNI